jgi:hypothetical protein
MSRTARNHLSRTIALAGVLAMASLIQPQVGQAQAHGPEQAFLNRTPAGTGLTPEFSAHPTSYTGPAVIIELSGERALLGRTDPLRISGLDLSSTAVAPAPEALPIDGERALLGRLPVSQPRRSGDWVQQFAGAPSIAATALAPPSDRFLSFTLGATGAINLAVSSDEARYGMITDVVDGSTRVVISLGATSAGGSLTLTMSGNRLPPSGRYAVRSGEDREVGGLYFQALFVAGSPERPGGAFHGESGWVTITRWEGGRISGEFELLARGFLASDLDDENQRVTVLGRFEARGNSTTFADARQMSRSSP